MTSRSEFDRLGFRASDIYPFLDRLGISLGHLDQLPRRDTAVGQSTDWMRSYIGRHEIPLGDAAMILAGIPTVGAGSFLSDEEQEQFALWRNALIDGINNRLQDGRQEIEASSWSASQDHEQMLSHADVRAWCSRRGHKWPIPEPTSVPVADTQVLAENARLRAQVDALKADLSEARGMVHRVDHPNWPPELDAALLAWQAANAAPNSTKTPLAFMKAWLKETYGDKLTDTQVDRIATVANWEKAAGRPRGKK